MHVVCIFLCNVQKSGHFPWVLHACYMKNYIMHATCIQHFSVQNCCLKELKLWAIVIDMCTYLGRSRVAKYSDIKRFRTDTYNDIYLAYALFSHASNMTCYVHVAKMMHMTCLLFNCHSCYMCCLLLLFNVHTTCILLQLACCLYMRYTWLYYHSCYRHVQHVRARKMHVTCIRFA